MIFDLDSRDGGKIIGQTGDTLGTGALKVESLVAGKTAISILSTASGAAVQISAIQGIGIDVDARDATAVAGDFRSVATGGRALEIGRTVLGSPTIGALRFLAPSTASAAVMELQGGFISCTSIEFTNAAQFDYAIPISLNGVIRYIPVCTNAAVDGGAAL